MCLIADRFRELSKAMLQHPSDFRLIEHKDVKREADHHIDTP